MDFEQARKNMLDCQLRPNKVTAAEILSAFAHVPREKFVAEDIRALSYLDEALPLNESRNMMSPCIAARLLQALEITSDNLVLVVGCGNGYEVALISQMADMVIGLEEDDDMIATGTIYLAELNIGNAEIAAGDLRLGVPSEAPFDAILVCGGAEEISDELKSQLSDGGKLAYIHLSHNQPMGEARLITKRNEACYEQALFDAHAKALTSFSQDKTFTF